MERWDTFQNFITKFSVDARIFFSKIIEFNSTRYLGFFLAIISISFAMLRDTFLQNGNDILLPLKCITKSYQRNYSILDNSKFDQDTLNYIFVLDVSKSIDTDKKIVEIPNWYKTTFRKVKAITSNSMIKLNTESILNFDIIQMRLFYYLCYLRDKNNPRIKFTIWTVGDEAECIYPTSSSQLSNDYSGAMKTLYANTTDKNRTMNTNFLSLLDGLLTNYNTYDSNRMDEKPKYVLVILSDLIHDVENIMNRNKNLTNDNNSKKMYFDREKNEINNQIRELSIQNLIANTVILENFYTNKSKNYRYDLIEPLTKYFKNYQISKYELTDSSVVLNTNIVLKNELNFYYENPYKLSKGTEATIDYGKKGNFDISLISFNGENKKMELDYKVCEHNNQNFNSRGRLILGEDKPHNINSCSNESINLYYRDLKLPDENNIRPALILRTQDFGQTNLLIPISFIKVLSTRSSILFFLLEISIIVCLINLFFAVYKLNSGNLSLQGMIAFKFNETNLLTLKIIFFALTFFIILIVIRIL